MTGRDASFHYKGKQIRFEVERYLPEHVIYSHRDCATGPVERLELELLGMDIETNTVIYRVIQIKTEKQHATTRSSGSRSRTQGQ